MVRTGGTEVRLGRNYLRQSCVPESGQLLCHHWFNMPDQSEDKKPEEKNRKNSTTLSGKELIQLVIFAPVVFVWLTLAARIIWSASSNANTLDNIEGLLTALAVLTIPVSAGLGKIFEVTHKDDD